MTRTIPQIDKDITALYLAIEARHPEVRQTPRSWYGPEYRAACARWQNAWNAEPELRSAKDELYRERGEAQLEHDKREYAAAMKQSRAARPKMKKCPACGSRIAA